MSSTIIKTSKLGKSYQINPHKEGSYKSFREDLMKRLKHPFKREPVGDFWALREVDLTIKRGEAIGIIGSNGSGKSTLLKLLSRVTCPTEGFIELHGRIGSLLEVGTGFHPDLTGKENVYLSGTILGMKRHEILSRYEEIVDFSEIGAFIDIPVKKYSSGMFLRLAFSVMAHLQSEILIIDEILAVGDQNYQKKCFKKMKSMSQEGRTILIVSHQLDSMLSICPRAVWIKNGRLFQDGSAEELINAYQKESY